MRFANWSRRLSAPRSGSPLRARLRVEALEERVVPYTTTGGAWPSPQLITISFVPDGTIVATNGPNYVGSNLFARMNAYFGSPGMWQWQMELAAQYWAKQTNINFAVVPDNGTTIGQGAYQQGDPGMGDIRISGYNFGSSTLAQASLPPPLNNYSIAGDIQVNTGQPFTINNLGPLGGYDLFTVMAHEIGHALGMGHSSVYTAEMYGYYTGTKWALDPDDIAGIRSIYSANGPRSPDPWDAWYDNGSINTPTDFTPFINPTTLTFMTVGNVDITTTSDVDFYKFTVPSGFSGTLGVKVQSAGLSLLEPTLTVYNASQQQIGFASGAWQPGATLNLTLTSGVTAGQPIYVRVGQADTSAFGTGAYGLALNFGTGPMPTIPLPNTAKLNGSPLQSGGGLPDQSDGDGDPPGVDTFRTSAPPQATATASVANDNRSAPLQAARELAAAVLTNADRTSPAPSAAAPAAVPVVPLSMAASPVAPVPVLARTETPQSSGGGDQASPEELGEQAPQTPAIDQPGFPGLPEMGVPSPEAIGPEQSTAAFWRQASETCFVDPTWQATPAGTNDLVPMVLAEGTHDLVGILAGATVVVSSAWGAQPDQRKRYRWPRI